MRKNIFLFIDGIVSIVFSLFCFGNSKGDYIARYTYGADAYTGIQNAAAETGMNVMTLTEYVSRGFGFVLIVAGIALIAAALPLKKSED